LKHKKIMLIITEDCNLNCVYCYESNKRQHSMSFETAKQLIDNSFTDLTDYNGVTFELHGGEPFMNFPLIRQIDDYIMSAYKDYDVLFRITTNGILVHGEIQNWLSIRKERYSVMLSLDGKQEQHDANRKLIGGQGSFDKIDLQFFSDTWTCCPVSMTVNERNINFLAEGTIWIQEKGFDCLNAFEWAVDWELEKNIKIIEAEFNQLIEFYSNNPLKHICLLLNYDLSKFFEPIDDTLRYCVEIDDPIECYDAKGNYAPCHGFTEFTLGSEEKAKEFSCMSIRDFAFEEDNICHNCKLVRLCRTCFAANYQLTGSMQKQSREICVFNRMCISASIKIQRNRIHAGANEYVKNKDSILKAAEAIETYLAHHFI